MLRRFTLLFAFRLLILIFFDLILPSLTMHYADIDAIDADAFHTLLR